MPNLRIAIMSTALIVLGVVTTGCGSSTHTASSPTPTVATASSAPATAVAGTSSGAAIPTGSVLIDGAVSTPMTLTIDQLRTFPPQTQSVSFSSGSGPQSHQYTGAAITDLLASAKPVIASAKNAVLRLAVIATGSDGYQAALSYGELLPDFGATPALLAYTEDNKPLDAPRLIVPGDVKGGRYVTGVTTLHVVDLGS